MSNNMYRVILFVTSLQYKVYLWKIVITSMFLR